MTSRDVVEEENQDVKEKKIPTEIGNLTAITRPVTRSFRAQLITNAIPENQKKPMAVNVNKLKATIIKTKPPPVPQNATVIEISPDTKELKKPKSWSSQNKSPQSSLTSTLTARSKAARCPKQPNVVDIDAQDVDNELAAVEYVDDIYKFYKLVERIKYAKQDVLVMEKRILSQLEWSLTVPTPYVFLTRLIKAAAAITPLEIEGPFCNLIMMFGIFGIQTREQMVYFYAELGMMNYQIIIRFCPSLVVTLAVYVARNARNKNPVSHKTLEMHTGFTETQLMECVKMLVVSSNSEGWREAEGNI
ncbi:unnamed protein product [Lactuca virosa]|uniref:Cyclin C-terminal domain-containing protein n=1 Tax=Lactuca virosa TaxID=75947 RepID=A0AAU9MR08_9ASTR|nr:unnamed protein product [Lactuca virosa]